VEKGGFDRPYLFCGDILFAGSIGRTDLPGSTGEEVLVSGIREKLFPLPGETIVFPGHGEATTIEDEKENNPLCGSKAG
jgi:glyoxylase-like metal-dependent hydrolase (beta-lactamase superfamily II)